MYTVTTLEKSDQGATRLVFRARTHAFLHIQNMLKEGRVCSIFYTPQ